MKVLLRYTLLLALFPGWLTPSAVAQARTYEALNFDVPFKFDIGKQTFRPGHYQVLFVGSGLAVMRDEKSHIVASLITRTVDTGRPSNETKVVFDKRKNHSRLSRLCIEHRMQDIEIVGEQMALRQASPVMPAPLPSEINGFFDRRAAPMFTH